MCDFELRRTERIRGKKMKMGLKYSGSKAASDGYLLQP